MRSARFFAPALAIAAFVAVALGASAASSGTAPLTNAKHFFWAQGQDPTGTANSLTNDIIYHGGNAGPDAIGVETTPAVYLVYWGTEWANGFTTPDTDGKLYSSKTLQSYLNSFFTYVVLTPPQTIATGQPVYCGYHTQTTSINGIGNPYRLQYAFIPFLNYDWPGLGNNGCGMHNVNAKSDAFGNGIFDGYSIVTGHEYSEAVTDPDNFFSVQDGWNDDQTSENADKCAWYHTQNISLGGHAFAVQPTWSNEAFDAGKDGCAVSR